MLIDECINIAYWMRGGIQYPDTFNLTFFERQRFGTFISDRLENEAKKSFPNY